MIVGQDFFKLCEELLPRFRNYNKIMQISAMNFSNVSSSNAYTFQKKPYVWGWATWKRAWDKMDMEMKEWPSFKMKSVLKYYGWFQTLMMWNYWQATYTKLDKSSSWATRWHFSVVYNNGICICPKANLSVNIGCNDGTHYREIDNDPYSYLKIGSLKYPLVHPNICELDEIQLNIDNKDFLRVRKIGLRKKLRDFLHW